MRPATSARPRKRRAADSLKTSTGSAPAALPGPKARPSEDGDAQHVEVPWTDRDEVEQIGSTAPVAGTRRGSFTTLNKKSGGSPSPAVARATPGKHLDAFERFETGEQAPLPLVEQAGEQHDRGTQFLRHQVGLGQGPYETGRGHQQAPRAQLVCLLRAVGRAVEELTGERVPCRSWAFRTSSPAAGDASSMSCQALARVSPGGLNAASSSSASDDLPDP